jgi:hypothetical protein
MNRGVQFTAAFSHDRLTDFTFSIFGTRSRNAEDIWNISCNALTKRARAPLVDVGVTHGRRFRTYRRVPRRHPGTSQVEGRLDYALRSAQRTAQRSTFPN